MNKTTTLVVCALLVLVACTTSTEEPVDYNEDVQQMLEQERPVWFTSQYMISQEQTLVCYEAYDYENKVCLDTTQFRYDCHGNACMEEK